MDQPNLKELMDSFAKLKKLFHTALATRCKDYSLSSDQAMLLTLLKEEKMRQKEIAKKLHISEATLSVRMKRLESAGLIERKSDPLDKRHYQIFLTELGKKEEKEAKEIFCYMNSLLLDPLDDKDIEDLKRIVDKVLQELKEEIV